jgi:DNA-binding transcriptional MerR regulator
MIGRVVDAAGVEWWDTGYACAQLGVQAANLRDWVRRGLVEAPRRHGRTAAYRAEQLLEAELRTASAQRGRRRAGITAA